MNLKNRLAIQYLTGKGLELGALHNPIKYDPQKATVMYADKLNKLTAIECFPELEELADSIVETDVIFDLDRDDYQIFREYDFIIANHVIEHVVNPIRFIKETCINLKKDALLLLTVPDKEYTHDKNRKLTRYRHVLMEYYLNVKHLSNRHIKDYLKNKLPVENVHPKTKEHFLKNKLPLSYYNGNKLPLNPLSRIRLYNYHRSRSIHVHVWNRESFDFFIHRTISLLDLQLEIVENPPPEESPGEIIYLLRKRGQTPI